MTTEKNCYVIVPCYNEAARFPRDEFLNFARIHPQIFFILVNDGSTDGTKDVLESLSRDLPENFHVLNLNENAGKAEAVRTGIAHALESFKPEKVAYWDADLATPLEVIPQFMEDFEKCPSLEILLGSRVQLLGTDIYRSPVRHYLGRTFATCASMVLKLPVYDTQCGAKMFRVNEMTASIFKEPFGSRWIFDVELLARYLKAKKLDRTGAAKFIHEKAIPRWHDVSGSKVKPLDFFKAFFELIRIAFKY